jgi:hypothetical protein
MRSAARSDHQGTTGSFHSVSFSYANMLCLVMDIKGRQYQLFERLHAYVHLAKRDNIH